MRGVLWVACLLAAVPASAELLNPQAFPSLGSFDTTAGGSFTIDTDALTITNDAAPGTPLFVGVIDAQGGLADSYGPGGAVTTVGPAGIPHIAVFTFSDLVLGAASSFTIVGHRALALLSRGNATIDTELRLNGEPGSQVSNIVPPSPPDYSTPGLRAGPGGFDGGTSAGWGIVPTPGQGPGGGGSSMVPDTLGLIAGITPTKGATGSHASVGRNGSCGGFQAGVICVAGTAAPATTDPLDAVLRGGSGGGAAQYTWPFWFNDPNPTGEITASGHGGGGAIEIGASGLLTLGPLSSIDACALDASSLGNSARSGSGGGSATGGYGAAGAVRLHAARLVNLGSGNVSAQFRHSDPGLNLFGTGSGTILMRGIDSAFVVGQPWSLTPGQFGAALGNGVFSLDVNRVLVLSGESFELSSHTLVQAQTPTLPRIEVSVENIEIQEAGTGTIPPGGFASLYEIRLGGPLALLSGTAALTNAGVLRGEGTVSAPVTNAAGGRIDISNESLGFAQSLLNLAGASVSVVAGALTVPGDGLANDDGLVNLGTLNLVAAIVDGDVRSPAGSQINVAGAVEFNGFVSGAASFSGTQNLIVFNGGYSPGDSPALIAFGGHLAFGPAGTLSLEIGGSIPGSEHDRLDVAGALELAGSVELLPIGGFVPSLSSSFTLLTFGSRTGEFASVAGVQQAGELDLALAYAPGAVVVTTVRRGDVNGDGLLSAADTAIVEAAAAVGLVTTAYAAGDVDGSGGVDAADVTIVAVAVGGAPSIPALGAWAKGVLALGLCAVALARRSLASDRGVTTCVRPTRTPRRETPARSSSRARADDRSIGAG